LKLSSATALRRTGEVRRGVEVEIGGRRLTLTNLEKPMYPTAGMTKGEVIDYYGRVARRCSRTSRRAP
jgi:bifunctional non-homologous end joining protein LigD